MEEGGKYLCGSTKNALMVFANVTISCFYYFWNKQALENNQVDTWLIVRTKYILTWICSNSKNRKMKYRSVGQRSFRVNSLKKIYSLAILNTMVSPKKVGLQVEIYIKRTLYVLWNLLFWRQNWKLPKNLLLRRRTLFYTAFETNVASMS